MTNTEQSNIIPFDLNKALQGQPVLLRNGMHAKVRMHPDTDNRHIYYPILGEIVFNNNLNTSDKPCLSWTKSGELYTYSKNNYDIIGMVPEKSYQYKNILEKSYLHGYLISSVKHKMPIAQVIGKHRNGKYIVQSINTSHIIVTDNDDDWNIHITFDLNLLSDIKTLVKDLPNPFKPKENESYYAVGLSASNLILELDMDSDRLDKILIERGNAFKTEEEAQQVADFMLKILAANKEKSEVK